MYLVKDTLYQPITNPLLQIVSRILLGYYKVWMFYIN